MVKYFKGMTAPLVIGDKPDWYTGSHIQADQLPGNRRELQIITKLLLAEGVVMYCSDDVYALEPFDENIPDYYFRTCKQMRIVARDRKYKEMYKRCPDHWLNFDIHQPMVIDVEKYRTVDLSEDRPIKTLYANTFPKHREEMKDGKIKDPMTYEKIRAHITGRKFFSTSGSLNDPLQKVLNELYPEPSPYEC